MKTYCKILLFKKKNENNTANYFSKEKFLNSCVIKYAEVF
jgi:hypothetical protein